MVLILDYWYMMLNLMYWYICIVEYWIGDWLIVM